MSDFDFDSTVSLGLRDLDRPGSSPQIVFIGTLRTAVTIVLALPPSDQERAVITGPGLPEVGLPPPPFAEIALDPKFRR
jgi:hypothetical protein